MIKYVNHGSSLKSVHMYAITLYKTQHGSYKVEVLPCDHVGRIVSDAVAWDIFPNWWSAYKYLYKQYKEYRRYVNGRN